MKKIIFFALLFFLLSFVSATLNLSPGRLDFEVGVGQELCKYVKISSLDYSSTIKLRDIWVDDINEININKYNLTAKDYGLTISYIKQIDNFDGEEQIEVCVRGNKIIDKTRGDLIFTPYSSTNVIVEVGGWLFVTILESSDREDELVVENNNPSSPSSSSSGGGSTSDDLLLENDVSLIVNNSIVVNNYVDGVPMGELEDEVVVENESVGFWSGVTGSVIGSVGGNWGIVVGVLVLVGIVSVFVWRKKE